MSQFFLYLKRSNLVEEDTLDEIAMKIRKKLGTKPDSEFDQALATTLVNRNYLNSWQISQLKNGRIKFNLGPYQIIDSIGSGGYGMVFLAKHADFEQGIPLIGEKRPLFAVKVLPISKATPELIDRFLHEIEIQKNLSNPYLVRFLDSGHDGNVHYMVHEYVAGGTLRQKIREKERIPFSEAAWIISEIAVVLEYLHENKIVHRDVKPSNILLSPTKTGFRPGLTKLADFGLSCRISPELDAIENALLADSIRESRKNSGKSGDVNASMLRKVAGTADYLAPDQITDPNNPTGLWDVYSLGCTFYHAVTGIVPFPMGDSQQKILAHMNQTPPDPREFCSSLPHEVAKLMLEMMTRDPKRRIASLREVITRLLPWTNELYKPPADIESLQAEEPVSESEDHENGSARSSFFSKIVYAFEAVLGRY
ncbi:MAG: serine/threonine protein kinase [Thermoguttaceae bacterium]